MNNDLQGNVATVRAIPIRHHSKQLASTIRLWASSAEWNTPTDLSELRSVWSDRIKAIAAEASFLGFTRTLRLCRALHAAVQKLSRDFAVLSNTQRSALSLAVKSLNQMVENHQIETVDSLRRTIRELQSEFSLSDDACSARLNGEMNALTSDLTSGVEADHGTLEHRDLDVYRNARLDSLDQCIEEESWIVSQLASLAEDLASGTHSGHPAGRLMRVLRNHKFFNQVDRVCLAGRVAHANQLVVVDASLSDRCPENPLKKGYSCFVNPNGSLFKMRPGTVRVFGDCERVLASFAEQGKPAQRSIALISEQGLRSGLCLAIGRGIEIQGFLFLNSIQEDLFCDITVNSAPLLSLFGLVATIGLDTSGFHLTANANTWLDDSIPSTSTIFEKTDFQRLVEKSLELLGGPGNKAQVQVSCTNTSDSFLYLPTTIIGMLAELMFRTRKTTDPIAIEVKIENGEVQLAFAHQRSSEVTDSWNWLKTIVKSANADFSNKPVSVRLTESDLVVTFPLEPLLVGHKELLYSTAY